MLNCPAPLVALGHALLGCLIILNIMVVDLIKQLKIALGFKPFPFNIAFFLSYLTSSSFLRCSFALDLSVAYAITGTTIVFNISIWYSTVFMNQL